MERTILREQIVCSADDKLLYESTQFPKLLFALSLDGIRRISIAPTDDGVFEVLAEVILGT